MVLVVDGVLQKIYLTFLHLSHPVTDCLMKGQPSAIL